MQIKPSYSHGARRRHRRDSGSGLPAWPTRPSDPIIMKLNVKTLLNLVSPAWHRLKLPLKTRNLHIRNRIRCQEDAREDQVRLDARWDRLKRLWKWFRRSWSRRMRKTNYSVKGGRQSFSNREKIWAGSIEQMLGKSDLMYINGTTIHNKISGGGGFWKSEYSAIAEIRSVFMLQSMYIWIQWENRIIFPQKPEHFHLVCVVPNFQGSLFFFFAKMKKWFGLIFKQAFLIFKKYLGNQ